TGTMPKSIDGGAIAPPESMNVAVIAVTSLPLSVGHVSVSVSVVAALWRAGVTDRIADVPGRSVVGYTVGAVNDSANGEALPSAGASRASVAVPVDANVMFDDVVGWLTQNVPTSTASGKVLSADTTWPLIGI